MESGLRSHAHFKGNTVVKVVYLGKMLTFSQWPGFLMPFSGKLLDVPVLNSISLNN